MNWIRLGEHPGETWRGVLDFHGMSQSELARRTEISKKHINQIMMGNALPSGASLVRMCIELDKTRPPEKRDGGMQLARAMNHVQSHWVLIKAWKEVNGHGNPYPTGGTGPRPVPE